MFRLNKLHIAIIFLYLCCIHAQQRYSTLIRSSLEDEIVILSVDKPVYFPGDTVILKIQRNDSAETVVVTPILIIEDAVIKSVDHNIYSLTIPQACKPGRYKIRLKILDAQGRHYVYETDCTVDVEEHQVIERISAYVHFEPKAGSEYINSAVTLDREQIRNLKVIFKRENIRVGMGPQFVTIRTTIQSRDRSLSQTFERRVLTFRSDDDSTRDREMLIQYRTAYGLFAAIRTEEFSQVHIQLDSLPDWAIIKIVIEPDYSIKIGGYDRSNFYTRYFRVKGPTIEVGFSLGIPKVLYDSQSEDTLEYGNTSAMVRFYYVNEVSGNRFPLNLGVGTFGVSSPLDVNFGRGGFALSMFLDLVEMTSLLGIDLNKKVTAGLEFAPFFPVRRKMRFLITAQVGISL